MYAVDTKAITDQSDKNQMVKTTGACEDGSLNTR